MSMGDRYKFPFAGDKVYRESNWAGRQMSSVIEELRDERLAAEAELAARITVIEERLRIVNDYNDFDGQYPELVEAYKKFKHEEEKMLTFEALKNSGDNGS